MRLRNLPLQKKDKYYVSTNGGSTFLLVLLLCLFTCPLFKNFSEYVYKQGISEGYRTEDQIF